MTQPKQLCQFFVVIAIAIGGVGIRDARSAPPNVIHANVDYDASGYVTPAGMVPPHMYQGGVMPVGYFGGGCDTCAGGCDGGCDSGGGCSTGGCSCSMNACSLLGSGGLLGKLCCGTNACGGCGNSGCGACGGLTNLRHLCLFCQGGGCSACQFLGRGYLLGALSSLAPYSEAGMCAQRWYDLSAEVLFLTHDAGGGNRPVTSLGTGPTGPIVLGLGAADSGQDLEAGVRLSGSMIWGPGGNLEASYLGGSEWKDRASVSDIPGAGLFSFISNFGQNPINGFDDTDRSLVQSLDSESDFHSVELNYRRRTVGPYCRFQGSWLFGLRYLRYDDRLIYSTVGENNNTVNANLPRFFSSNDKAENSLFGPQIGMDLWWNVRPGVSVGLGAKGAWMKNDIDRRSIFTANSLSPTGSPGVDAVVDGDHDTTIMGEFEAKMVYRLTHSFSIRSAYYAIAVEDVAFGTVDGGAIRDFVQNTAIRNPAFQLDSIVVQGFSFGTEYIW